MSEIEYNNLLFEISKSLDELNVREQLMFSCRGKLASGSEDNLPDVLSLFKELEACNHLGPDRLGIMKTLVKGVKQYELLGKVKKFENERKEYLDLLEKIIPVLDELNDLERLISICRAEIPEANESNIHDVRSLFKELENQSCLGTDSLGVLKGILTQTEQNNLLEELDKFEEQRNREDLFETRRAQASAFVSSVRNNLIGVLNIKNVFKLAAGGLITATTLDVFSRGSSFDELVTVVNRCVLPAGTSLIQITEGCVCLTIQADSLSALDNLWSLYQDGTLKARLETFFVTDQLRELAYGEQVETFVTIEEQEYERARIELIGITQTVRESEDVKSPRERRRRNSDSDLYCKAIDIQIRETEKKQQFLEDEKYAFVQRYLENVVETQSITTDTSDSGVKTHGAPSELSSEDISETADLDETQRLCVRHLRPELANELKHRIDADTVAARHICQSFGINGDVTAGAIFKLFPDTPLHLLRDVFESLELLDLVELLDKQMKSSTSRSLRAVLNYDEIRKLKNTDSRPVTFHSKAAVLILAYESPIDTETALFFGDLNLNSTTTILPSHPLQMKSIITMEMRIKRRRIRELMNLVNERKQAGIPETDVRVRELTGDLESKRQRLEWLEKELKEIENTEEHCLTAASGVIDKWIQCQDDFSLFAVFDLGTRGFFYDLIMKLALGIPSKPKLIVTGRTIEGVLPETLLVTGKNAFGVLSKRLPEILKKRWQTQNLASMMSELKRTVENRKYFRLLTDVTITDTLSSLVRFKREEELR